MCMDNVQAVQTAARRNVFSNSSQGCLCFYNFFKAKHVCFCIELIDYMPDKLSKMKGIESIGLFLLFTSCDSRGSFASDG